MKSLRRYICRRTVAANPHKAPLPPCTRWQPRNLQCESALPLGSTGKVTRLVLQAWTLYLGSDRDKADSFKKSQMTTPPYMFYHAVYRFQMLHCLRAHAMLPSRRCASPTAFIRALQY